MRKLFLFMVSVFMVAGLTSSKSIMEDWWTIDDASGYQIDVNSITFDQDGRITESIISGLDNKNAPADIILCPGTGEPCSVTIKQGNTTWTFNEYKKKKGPNWIKQ